MQIQSIWSFISYLSTSTYRNNGSVYNKQCSLQAVRNLPQFALCHTTQTLFSWSSKFLVRNTQWLFWLKNFIVIVAATGVSRTATMTMLVTLGSLESSHIHGTPPHWSHSLSLPSWVPCIQCESGTSWGELWCRAQWLLVRGRSLLGEALSEELGHSTWSLTWSESAKQKEKQLSPVLVQKNES